MKKILAIVLSCAALTLAGCHSQTKDERYNNLTATQIYDEGIKNIKKQRYTQAIEDFEALESRYPFGEYADKAQLGAIYAYYLNEDYPAALPAVDRFIRMYPRHHHVDYAYYMKGLINFNEALGFYGKYFKDHEERDTTTAKKGIQAFNSLLSAFPNSTYAPDAAQRVLYLRNQVAAHELVAARFYMRKGAYLAASNRANIVIEEFDQTPSMPEALAIMINAYRKLELNHLADDAYRVLVLNYPNSPYVEELG